MDGQHLVIKVILIAIFVVFALFVLLPGRSVRHAALRRLVLVAAFILAALAVIFPDALAVVAGFVGVGRGVDLLLYGLIVVFVGNALVQQRHMRVMQRELTLVARRQAISEARHPSDEADNSESSLS